MEIKVLWNDKKYTIKIEQKENNYRYKIGDDIFDAGFQLLNKNELMMILENRNVKAEFIQDKENAVIYIDGERYEFKEEKGEKEEVDDESYENVIKAPMPGLIVKIGAKRSDYVKKGDILVVLEAMKMQHEMRSKGDMIVKDVYVKEGDQVDAFAKLVELSPIE